MICSFNDPARHTILCSLLKFFFWIRCLFWCKNRMLNTILFSLGHCMKEIFSSWTHKTEHFQKIQRKTGIPYKSMLFFDDEDRNMDPVITYSHCARLILAISKI